MNIKSILGSAVLAATLAGEVPLAAADTQGVRFEPAVGTTQAQYVPVVRHRRYYRRTRPVYVVRRRSRKKSAAIVGGSALGGAAIGALAGGGKGAAIGAVAGGGAGLVYDRATHKKVIRER
jgi:outer membrane lipoprotein SlyB